MNVGIANILKENIVNAAPAFLDKISGLARTRVTKDHRYPVACDAIDQIACGTKKESEMIPSPLYKSVIFFDGTELPTVDTSRPVTEYTSRLRLVCWINCKRFGDDCNCAEAAMIELQRIIERPRYTAGNYRNILHRVTGGVQGTSVYDRYKFNEAETQYASHPYDCFALDIQTLYLFDPKCVSELVEQEVECSTPVMQRRKYPREFSIEELIDTSNGLTPAQLMAVCPPVNTYDMRVETPSGAIDGSNATFTSSMPFVMDSMEAYINGVLQRRHIDFSMPSTTTIQFTTSPSVGDSVTISYEEL